jgi:hypothetical protein
MSEQAYYVNEARYAQNKVAVRFPKPETALSIRATMLFINSLDCKNNWSHRERAYIVSQAKVDKLQLLLDNGMESLSGQVVYHDQTKEKFPVDMAIRMIKSGEMATRVFNKILDQL